MKDYYIALAAGLIVGIFYGTINVRSPAPPIVALVGLFGILVGEQVAPVVKRWLGGEGTTLSQLRNDCREHMFGPLPTSPKDPTERS